MENDLVDIVVTGNKDYKGWVCTYVGDGCIVMEKDGKKISAHRSIMQHDHWMNYAWRECKIKIDSVEQ